MSTGVYRRPPRRRPPAYRRYAATFASVTSPSGGNASLSGPQTVGSSVTCTTTGWANTPTSYTFTVKRADDAAFTVNVATVQGPTTSALNTNTYALGAADDGKYIRFEVVATNASGSSGTITALSNKVTYPAPTNTVAPQIFGTAAVGQLLTVTTGTWTPGP